MNAEELRKTNEYYDANIEDWAFYALAYKGGRAFIEEAIGGQNTRESLKNYQERLEEAYSFNYVASIVDLFNFYLTEKPTIRDVKDAGLENDRQWKMFLKDCDQNGTDFEEFMNEAQKRSSVQGTVGILVNKPNVPEANTIQKEIERRIYPYCSVYTVNNVLDWKYEKDPYTGRKKLMFLKLKDGDGRFHLWWPHKWEVWEITDQELCMLYEEGENPLGEIPWVWMQNLKDISSPYFGKSDIVDISWIVASIVRNLSCGEEILKWAGFPMMRVPMTSEDYNDQNQDGEVETGSTAVHQFNPEFGEGGKPDWMETEVLDPIEAILKWIDRKVDEIFRMAHLSGVHGQRKSNNEVASGLALRYEFQQLTSVLYKKSVNKVEAERSVVRFWLMWQKKEWDDEKVDIRERKNISVDDLSVDLENLRLSMKSVMSEMFRVRVQQTIVRQALPDLSDKDRKEIDKQIEDAHGKIPEDVLKSSDKKNQYD